MANQVNDIISEICNKLNVTTEYAVGEYARYMIATSTYFVIIFGIIAVILGFVLKKAIKYDKENNYKTNDGTSILVIIALIIALILFFGKFSDIVAYTISPTGALIDNILNRIS